MDGWRVEFAPSFLENGRARCAELRVAGHQKELLQVRFYENSFSGTIAVVYQWIQGAF